PGMLKAMEIDSRSEQRLGLVLDLTRQALTLEDPNALWPFMADKLISFFGCERVTIFQRGDKDRLVSRYAHGRTAPPSLRVGEGVAGHAAATGEPSIANAPYQDERFVGAVDERTSFKTENLLAFPLLYRGKAVAVLELINKRGGFGEADLEDLRAIG